MIFCDGECDDFEIRMQRRLKTIRNSDMVAFQACPAYRPYPFLFFSTSAHFSLLPPSIKVDIVVFPLDMRRKDVLSLLFSLCFTLVNASVTIYDKQGQATLGQSSSSTDVSFTTTAAPSGYTGAGLGPYDPDVLQAPAVPNPLPSMNFGIQLQSSGTTGLSIQQAGNFYGFSIEFSVITQVSEYRALWPSASIYKYDAFR